jgi:putative transposase
MLGVVPTEQTASELHGDLDAIVREGARRMLAAALEAEVDAYLAAHAAERDERARRLVVRNGHARERQVVTAAGAVAVRAPRVDDRRVDPATGGRVRFRSVLLPPWCRKSPKVAEVLPLLYLHGLSTGDFVPALEAFFGSSAGQSAAVHTRLVATWQGEYEAFCRRDLSDRDYVHAWADGVHFRVRLEQARLCCLVIVGVRADGTKELVAVGDGERESTDSWAELLRDLRRRGMQAPVVAVGDGALGLWAALRDVFPVTRHQRDWVHKVANVLACLPASVQAGARRALAEIRDAPDRDHAQRAIEAFVRDYGTKWPKAVAKVTGDTEALLAFFDFPADHWGHLKTTNPIESTFATVRLRTRVTKGPAARPRDWRWRSSCSRPRRTGGGRSTGRSWSRWCAPGRDSRGACGWSARSWPHDPAAQPAGAVRTVRPGALRRQGPRPRHQRRPANPGPLWPARQGPASPTTRQVVLLGLLPRTWPAHHPRPGFCQQVEAFLASLGWAGPEITDALVSLRRHLTASVTVEERIIHDANAVEVLGAFGIAKAFTTGGARGQSYEQTVERYEQFLDQTRFVTPAGQALARDGRAYARAFLRRFKAEAQIKEPPSQTPTPTR